MRVMGCPNSHKKDVIDILYESRIPREVDVPDGVDLKKLRTDDAYKIEIMERIENRKLARELYYSRENLYGFGVGIMSMDFYVNFYEAKIAEKRKESRKKEEYREIFKGVLNAVMCICTIIVFVGFVAYLISR